MSWSVPEAKSHERQVHLKNAKNSNNLPTIYPAGQYCWLLFPAFSQERILRERRVGFGEGRLRQNKLLWGQVELQVSTCSSAHVKLDVRNVVAESGEGPTKSTFTSYLDRVD